MVQPPTWASWWPGKDMLCWTCPKTFYASELVIANTRKLNSSLPSSIFPKPTIVFRAENCFLFFWALDVVDALMNMYSVTSRLTCLLESGILSLEAVVKNKQSKFLRRMYEKRDQLSASDPLMHNLNFMQTNYPELYESLNDLRQRDDNFANHPLNLPNCASICRWTPSCLYTRCTQLNWRCTQHWGQSESSVHPYQAVLP